MRRAWAAAGVAVAIAFAAEMASAVALRDVRVGVHAGYTRVVLETDAKAAYAVSRTGDSVTVRIQASGRAESFASKGQQLAKVEVSPAGAETSVRLALRGPVTVKESIFTGPHRVVLDLYPGTETTAAAETPAPPPAEPEPPPAPEPERPKAVAGTGHLTPEELAAAAAADAETTPRVPEPGDATMAESPLEEETLAEGDQPAAPETAPAPAPPAPPSESARPDAPSGGGGFFRFFRDLSPVVPAAIAIVLLLVAWRAWARAKREDRAYATPLGTQAADDEEAAEAREDLDRTAGFVAPPAVEEPEEAPFARPAPDEEPSLFDVAPEEIETPPPAPEPPKPVVTLASSAIGDEEVGGDMAAIVRELERRIAHLETRLEEVVDSKDRLERQVSAQTEELRVQRAAIARTQRVLRTLARPEDEASEPVPKP